MLGLPAVLSARPASGPPLLVVGPAEARDWLAALAPHHVAWRYEFLPLQHFSGAAVAGAGAVAGAAAVMGGRLGFSGWTSVAVDHCHGAFGLVLEHSQVRCSVGCLLGGSPPLRRAGFACWANQHLLRCEIQPGFAPPLLPERSVPTVTYSIVCLLVQAWQLVES